MKPTALDGGRLHRRRKSQALAKLAAAMPDAARAVDAGPPHSDSAVDMLTDFIERAVDQLVRSAIPSDRRFRSGDRRASFDSVDEQWIAALQAVDSTLDGDSDALERLRHRARDWWRPVAISAASPFRLCFRLEEPPTDETAAGHNGSGTGFVASDGEWCLRYLLQAHNDPSLLVMAYQAWSAKGREAQLFKQNGFNISEFLLQSLGEAARICPLIGDSLRGGIPDGHQIGTAGAAEFLIEHAAMLERAGFGIMLPASWSTKGTKLRLTANARIKTPKMQAAAGLSMESLVNFDWQVALGDENLSREELTALAKLKTPLVKMRGQWVLLSAEEIQHAIALLDRRGSRLTAREAIRMALGGATCEGPRGRQLAGPGLGR
jgi:SNF2 Helicase protein